MASSSSSLVRLLPFLCLSFLLLFWLCFSFFFFVSFFFVGVAEAHTSDKEGALNDVRALIEFKKCITSDPLSVLKNWNYDDATACNWTGIWCSNKKHPGRVVGIVLENATLHGSLSPHISNLTFLHVLDIDNNSFSGTIPSSLGTLRRLKHLDLCSNQFDGEIPQQLGNLSSLQVFGLCTNSLNGEIPPSLAAFQDMKFFNVYQNQLGGQVPSWLGALNKLEKLDLGENNFHGAIPAELGNLSSSLTFLDLQSNYLRGFIPCSLGSLYRLVDFYLQQNNLNGAIPRCLRNLTALTELSLAENSLQGDLPPWIGSFNNLQALGLFLNGLTGNIPESWRNLTYLQVIDLTSNKLSGTLPLWLGTLCPELRRLHMGGNYFTSGVSAAREPLPIAIALSNCSSLNHIDIAANHLKGTLPPQFGSSLSNLQYLGLQHNFISGNIPPSIGNLSSLVELDLGDNVLSGTIPRQIANLKSIQAISLEGNKLQESIPSEISLLNKSLGYLYLQGNKLSGSIPSNIEKLVNLRTLYLNGNQLSGKIPSEMGNCPVLEDLVLSANNLSGPIPPEVAGLKTIIFNFDLSANYFTGEVPPEIAGLQMAQFINLSSNKLSGNMASYMDGWLDARQINLSLNNLGGNLSQSIGNKITQLQSMDLSANNFTGPVPASLFNHSALQFLNLSYNNFDAEVPCLNSSVRKLRLTRWSFLGNPNLCGRCYGLKACLTSPPGQHSSHFNKSTILKIVLAILGGLLLLVVAGILFIFRRIKKSKGEIPRISEKFLKISMEELQRATDNFSASNFLGQGRHGKVYRGVLSSGMVVAVKCFSSANHSETDKSFKKECQALGKVKHRNILKIITVVWSDELKALVIPFMSNGNLHSLLYNREDGRLTCLNLPMRIKVLTELARGLAYLHHDCDFQVIHCDIKPENVLFDEDMTVKISDFGISHLIIDHFDDPTTSSSLKGSVGYIAPEYGTGQRISIKGDVYSFGVVTLEVITRLSPTHEMFSGDFTLPLWISTVLKERASEGRKEMLKSILKMADEGGGGISMDKDEEMSMVESILKIGLRCTCHNASMRPSMKEVEMFLQSISGNFQNQMILPGNLEEVIKIVESQPPPYPKRVEAENSTFSSD